MSIEKVCELFAGIGGIGLGFKQAGFRMVGALDKDENAGQTYQANQHDGVGFNSRFFLNDITGPKHVMPAVPEVMPDVITAGFPCQAFSIAGKQQGFKDERGNVFFGIITYLKALQPKAIFLENVKNLVGHDGGNTFRTIQDELQKCGYHITYKVLNTAEYSDVPQNRERIYIIGFLNQAHAEAFVWPEPTHEVRGIRELLESNVDEAYFYDKSKYAAQLQAEMTNPDTLYQWRRSYVRENKRNLCPTLTANMGTGGHNVPLVLDGGRIRKLTPRECARFQGFPDNFVLPTTLSDATLYKQIGNSVSVPVVKRLAEEMRRVINA